MKMFMYVILPLAAVIVAGYQNCSGPQGAVITEPSAYIDTFAPVTSMSLPLDASFPRSTPTYACTNGRSPFSLRFDSKIQRYRNGLKGTETLAFAKADWSSLPRPKNGTVYNSYILENETYGNYQVHSIQRISNVSHLNLVVTALADEIQKVTSLSLAGGSDQATVGSISEVIHLALHGPLTVQSASSTHMSLESGVKVRNIDVDHLALQASDAALLENSKICAVSIRLYY